MKRPKKGSKFMNPKTGVIHVVKDVYMETFGDHQSLHYCHTWCACYFGVGYSEHYMHEWTPQGDGVAVTCKNCRRRLGLNMVTNQVNAYDDIGGLKRWLIGLAVRRSEENARLDTDFRLASSFCKYRRGVDGRFACKKVEAPSRRMCCIRQCPYFNIK